MLAVSQEIPEFPFVNRIKEKQATLEFIESRNGRTKLMCLIANGGVGKSRFLSSVIEEISTDIIILEANSAGPHGKNHYLLSQFFDKTISLLKGEFKKIFISEQVENVKKVSKNILVASANAIGAGSTTQELIKLFEIYRSNPFSPERKNERAVSINKLSKVLRKISQNRPLLIVLDDMHKLSVDEIEEITYLLSELRIYDSENIKVLISSRPEVLSNSHVSELIHQLSQMGLVSIYDIQPLSNHDLYKIAVETIANPILAKTLITYSEGNPQKFLNQLISLNLKGLLESYNGSIVLPSKENRLSVSDEFDIPLDSFVLLLMMAISIDTVYENHYPQISRNLGLNGSTDLVEKFENLNSQKIVKIDTDKEGRIFVQIKHDLIKEKLVSQLLNSNPLKRKRYLDITRKTVSHLIEAETPGLVTAIRKAGNKSDIKKRLKPKELQNIIRLVKCIYSSTPDDDEIIIGSIRLCSEGMAYSHLVSVTQHIRSYLYSGISLTRRNIKYCLGELINANYQCGEYEATIELFDEEKQFNSNHLYQVAMSHLILKKDDFTLNDVLNLVDFSKSNSRDPAEPLIRSVYEIALQETGFMEDADDIHALNIYEYEAVAKKNKYWHMFGIVSALFWKNDYDCKSCTTALRYFKRQKDPRYVGMAEHNLGYCAMNQGDFEEAAKKFKLASEYLGRCSPHEAIFPENNLAALEILRGEYDAAIERLYKCIFRTNSEDYLTTFRINLSQALHGAGRNNPLGIIELSNTSGGMRKHSYKNAIYTYVKSLLIALSMDSVSTQKMKELHSVLIATHHHEYIANHWNMLCKSVLGDSACFDYKIKAQPTIRMRDSHVFNPEKSLYRPCLLGFGHV